MGRHKQRKCNACTKDLTKGGQSYCSRCSRIRRTFNVRPEDIEALRRAQFNECAICGARPTEKDLAVDHDHDSGRVRGFLCQSCNLGIGLLRHSVPLLQKSIDYLQKPFPGLRMLSVREAHPSIPDSEVELMVQEALDDPIAKSIRGKSRILAIKIGSSEEAAMSKLRRRIIKNKRLVKDRKDEALLAEYLKLTNPLDNPVDSMLY